ncbi:DUF1240 domain-containing protein [Xenorhabdus griffiniae]|uniref:DUF1240 domain-containing protein n=1 Tax=Xenorhabdus griffiniae TaxID=351672 RepID=UPI0030D1F971
MSKLKEYWNNLSPTAKQRWSSVGALLMFISFDYTAIAWGFRDLLEMLSYPDVIHYNSFITFYVLFPLFTFPLLLIFTYALFTGRVVGKFGTVCIHIFGILTISSICINIAFSWYYTNTLDEKIYIRCSGTPTGGTHGMSKLYVKDPKQCREYGAYYID